MKALQPTKANFCTGQRHDDLLSTILNLIDEEIMLQNAIESQSHYNPNHLLDVLLNEMQAKNDSALCRLLGVKPPNISKIRHHRSPVGASLLIRLHEITGISIRDLRNLMGDRRMKFRFSNVQGRGKRESKGESNSHAE
jgi:hypothetical protein